MQVVAQTQSRYSLDELVVGMTTDDSLYDAHGVLLIASGVEITPSLIDNLRRRGVRTLHRENTRSEPSLEPIRRPERSNKPRPRAVHPSDSRISSNYSAKKVERIKGQFAAGERAIAYLCQAVRRSSVTDLRRTDAHVEEYINELIDDPDPVIANALAYEADLELAHRCVQFSVLSMAIAQQMDFEMDLLRDLGSAALVHDWSLFDLPADSRFPHQSMTDEIRAQYHHHPITTVEMLNTVRQVSGEIKLFVSQVHEYLDGSGFPRRLAADQLHPASRVLCVADTYLTMTSPPKGCPRIVPCDAIAFLINGASQGKYSPKAVTALLHAVTVYPIGSIVELSDTTKARVIRGNSKDYCYPIVESLVDTTRIIDLKETELFVTRPILSTEYHEVRLPETYKELNEAIASR
jgi:HD-GYP domain-containing protein (c-di-GMP phosphodiesterase class II)